MYLTKSQAENIIENYAEDLGSDLLLKMLFVVDLLKEEDWTFVIKSHSLLESLMNELVDAYLGKPKLLPIIKKLPLHGNEGSKIAIAKSLDAITEEECKRITSLSIIRNRAVHRFEDIDFRFDNYIKSLDNNQTKNLKKSLLLGNNISSKLRSALDECYNHNPQIIFWYAIQALVLELTIRIHLKRGHELIETEASITTTEILQGLIK